MSDIDSEKSAEVTHEIDNKIKPKYNGYFCERCEYKTKKLKSFISHITRKIPCDTVKDYNYGVSKALEKYDQRASLVLSMLDQLEDNQEVDIKKLNKYVNEVERLGRVNSNFNKQDINEIRDIIKSKEKDIEKEK